MKVYEEKMYIGEEDTLDQDDMIAILGDLKNRIMLSIQVDGENIEDYLLTVFDERPIRMIVEPKQGNP